MNELFFIMGLTILTGFLSTFIFDKTRISQVILLMLFGFILGPMLGIIDASEGSVIVAILPFIATLALIVLLFDGGMSLDIFAVAHAIPRSTIFTIVVFFFGLVLVGSFMSFGLGWPILNGLLLASVIGGTSSAIVIAMVEKTGVAKETKSFLAVESTITDALCIITAMILLNLIMANQTPEAGEVVSILLSSFSIAILLGILSALAWVLLAGRFRMKKYAYMLTLAMVFGLFSVTEAVGGNGSFSVFVFGLMLGNSGEISRLLKCRAAYNLSHSIRFFQEEITFFVRTFFFVFMGLLLSPGYFTAGIIAVSVAVLALIVLSRYGPTRLMLSSLPKRDRSIVVAMLPRGLAAAVLATLPISNGLVIADFREIVFATILFTNVAATVGIFLFDKPENSEKRREELAEAIQSVEHEPPEQEDAGECAQDGEESGLQGEEAELDKPAGSKSG